MAGYSTARLRDDLRAGLNVALLAFPQGMAYATIAGLPIQYGLYASVIASILGPIFSGARFIVLGPTNATSVLLFAAFLPLAVTPAEKLAMLPLLLLMIGVFLLAGAFLKVASLIQYISRTVVTGYITAAAIYIIVNQVRKVLGFSIEIPLGANLFDIVWRTVTGLPQTHMASLVLGLGTVVCYLLISRYLRFLPNVALTLVVMSFVAFGLNHWLVPAAGWLGGPVELLNAVRPGDWGLTWPPLRDDWFSLLAPTALAIAFLSVLEGTSIGKTVAARAGERLNTDQEMYAMGMANVGCALCMGMPASGSLTRSQLNNESGANTPLSVVICGLICLLGVVLFGPFTRYIPSTVLGALVIFIGLSLINRRVIRQVMKTTRSDAIVFVVTFIAALLVRFDFAILLGAATSILLFLRKAAAPELVEYSFTDEGQLTELQSDGRRPNPEVSIVHVEGDLFFGAAELFRDQVRRICADPNLRVLVLKMRNAHHLDATSVMALEELVRYMNEHERTLLVSEVRKDTLRTFRNGGLLELIGRDNIFPDNPQNPTLSTAKALKRAMAFLGGRDVKVSIYAEEKKKARERAEEEEGEPTASG